MTKRGKILAIVFSTCIALFVGALLYNGGRGVAKVSGPERSNISLGCGVATDAIGRQSVDCNPSATAVRHEVEDYNNEPARR